MTNSNDLQLIAPCLFGLEAVVSRELNQLGYIDQQVRDGRVTFKGDASAICKANLWLRTAERVLLKVGDFAALSFDELFEGTKALPWFDYIPMDGEFPIEVNSINSKLASTSDCQSIIKKAIVESMKKKYKTDWFPENGPRYKINANILKDQVTLAIDTSGSGLHKRGYRTLVGAAPLKETLASAMIMISRWKKDRALIDPMCGSGTIPIEAAMIAKNVAPGLNRSFTSEKWVSIPADHWRLAREEAISVQVTDQSYRIQGSDIDDDAISLARYHAKMAGVENDIHLQRMPLSEISSKYKYGFIITNPPYGERLGESEEIKKLYSEMGKVFGKFDTWSYYILSSRMDLEKDFGRKCNKKRKLYNGMILCNYYQFYGPKPPREML
ncbi:MAG: class I SAM-dependent RNA methyltransferase [Eubacteriales bacterium]|nr:class I SAM-dependent RNA methyltransferase [Eubacteriales bacterium]